ncbi:hypothetical protein CRV08_02060 [Halarcobacter ebronensis]|uniref:Uncharacterized protein n=1 Tax=Halarcobacter ebronensis TaxID=1462615 RepID=A0A4Q0YG10_9BACT|nr:hypothetical protein [Halarcobacter ebronensis]RXJ69510.1 hypothetical protein CRV08_02060 [Halarcobacter ebronensis]
MKNQELLKKINGKLLEIDSKTNKDTFHISGGMGNIGQQNINTQINHYDFKTDKMGSFIKEIKISSLDKQNFEIEIDFEGLSIKMKELYESVEKYVYNHHLYKLDMNYLSTDNSHNSTVKLNNSIKRDIEQYIYELLYKYINDEFEEINYHSFYKNIDNIVKNILKDKFSKSTDKNCWQEDYKEGNALKIVSKYFREFFLPFDEHDSFAFFEYLDKNGVEYIRKDFYPKTIREFFENKINNEISYPCWKMEYEDLLDYDFEVMRRFLYLENPYKKTIFGLKQFIKDNKFRSYMYEEVDGMNPYSLCNICELKSWNTNNSTSWNDLKDNEDILKEYDFLEDKLEKHLKSLNS